jgi:hypothetical protein
MGKLFYFAIKKPQDNKDFEAVSNKLRSYHSIKADEYYTTVLLQLSEKKEKV